MKIGIVSDVHNNAAALEAAIDLMGDVDELFCAGDSVSQVRFTNDAVALLRQEYLFSRIVTVYGGSQQMQLDTIAKQILRLP